MDQRADSIGSVGAEPSSDRELKVYHVPVENIPDVWPHILPMLERALDKSEGDWVSKNILRELIYGPSLLHVAMTDEITGFAISSFDQRPDRSAFHIWILGGKDNLLDHVSQYESFARNMGAEVITFSTLRKGFERKSMGYRKSYTVYRKDL